MAEPPPDERLSERDMWAMGARKRTKITVVHKESSILRGIEDLPVEIITNILTRVLEMEQCERAKKGKHKSPPPGETLLALYTAGRRGGAPQLTSVALRILMNPRVPIKQCPLFRYKSEFQSYQGFLKTCSYKCRIEHTRDFPDLNPSETDIIPSRTPGPSHIVRYTARYFMGGPDRHIIMAMRPEYSTPMWIRRFRMLRSRDAAHFFDDLSQDAKHGRSLVRQQNIDQRNTQLGKRVHERHPTTHRKSRKQKEESAHSVSTQTEEFDGSSDSEPMPSGAKMGPDDALRALYEWDT